MTALLHENLNNFLKFLLSIVAFLALYSRNMKLSFLFSFSFCEMAEDETRRLLLETLSLFNCLLEENDAVEFQEALNEHRDYIHLRCSNKYGVSFCLSLLYFASFDIIFAIVKL